MTTKHKTYTEQEKLNILKRLDIPGANIGKELKKLGISRSTFYGWKLANQAERYNKGRKGDGRSFYQITKAFEHQKLVNEILAGSPCTVTDPLSERLATMAALQKDKKYSVHALCEAFKVDRGTYCNYIKRGKVHTGEIWYLRRQEEMKKVVERIFNDSKQRFGVQKVYEAMKHEGVAVSYTYVRKLMNILGLRSIRQNAKTIFERLSARRINRLARHFKVSEPNKVWVGDITYFEVKGRTYYICIVMDLFSRRIVGWKISTCNSTRLTKATISAAIAAHHPEKGLIFHSDQGANYTSRAYCELLRSHGIVQSFSAPGRPHDNAVAEAFFRNLKAEELYRHEYRSQKDLNESVAEYIDFYNEKRPHYANNGLSPNQRESK